MRKTKQLLNYNESVNIINRISYGVLSFFDEIPYSIPLDHIYMNGKLYFHTSKTGHKINGVGKQVSYTVVEDCGINEEKTTHNHRSVYILGILEEVESKETKKDVLETLVHTYKMKKIGFIGLGIMGLPMAGHLMDAGYEMHIYARHPEKVTSLVEKGATLHSTIHDCVKDVDAVMTIVGFPQDVEEVYFNDNNILDSVKEGTYLIDMTTTSPTLDQRIYEEGKKRNLHVLDAPVTGGDTGAKNATLSILVGGDKEDYEACLPLFEAMGTNINYQGPSGSGQHAKMANQIMIAGALSGVCEALTYASSKGLDLDVLLKSVSTGAAGSHQLDAFGPKILKADYQPGFFMKHFIKDMKLADEEAKELEKEGYGDLGTQALMKYYKKP